MLQLQMLLASMFIASLAVAIVTGFQRRARLTPEQRAKEDAEPFDDAI